MIGVIVTLIVLLAFGAPVASRVARWRPASQLLAPAFLFGSGIAAVALLGLSVAGVPWSLPLFAVVAFAISGCGLFVSRGTPRGAPAPGGGRLAPGVATLLALAVAFEHARFAIRSPLDEWDFLAIWGLKARTFLAAEGIDWLFLERMDNRFSNPDYPPLLPLFLDAHALLSGGWDGRWIGLFFTVFGLAAFVVAWHSVRMESADPILLVAAALLFAFPSFSSRIGLAEAPMIAFAVSSVVLIRRGLLAESSVMIGGGGLLLGFAAMTKNEGVALTAAVAVAAILFRPRLRLLVALLPGICLAAWWQILRALHDLPTARAAGSVVERVSANVANFRDWSPAIWTELEKPAFWLALLLMAAIAGVRALWRERFLGVVVVLQGLAIGAAYLVSHVDLRNELVYSWERLTHQAALLAALYVVHALIARKNERGGPEPASS